jgi:PmbA protein
VAKARNAGTPQACDVGDWTVVVEPAALGELLHFLLPHFSAQRVDEGASFLSTEGGATERGSGGLGKAYCGENVWLTEDFADPLHLGCPFDHEGSPSLRVPLLAGGVARGFVTDTEWSTRLNVPNTGHAVFDRANGPQARYPVVGPGRRSRDELIASTRRGILISRFWYIRVVDQRRTIVTGMTRDGTFAIENGKIGKGLRNLRFNVNVLELLQACEFSNERVLTGGYSYRIVVPAARFDRFTFSSVTAF